ncbi:MAG: shikimate kinase [Jatrophihabitans sp.]
MTPLAVLVGLPGAGKSTSGRRLAKILAVPFADSDQLLATSAGRSVQEIFAESGETSFRELEARTIADALDTFDGVLSLGGGALTTETTRDALTASDTTVVLLRASLTTLKRRVGDGRSRPLLAEDPAARLADLERTREPLYRQFATVTVDTDGRTPGQVAATIAARLHELGKV